MHISYYPFSRLLIPFAYYLYPPDEENKLYVNNGRAIEQCYFSPCREETGAQASIRTCALVCKSDGS